MGADDNSCPTVPILVISCKKEKIKIKEIGSMLRNTAIESNYAFEFYFHYHFSFVMKSQFNLGFPFRL